MMKSIEVQVQMEMKMMLKTREISRLRICFIRILEYKVRMLSICLRANLMRRMVKELQGIAMETLDQNNLILNQ